MQPGEATRPSPARRSDGWTIGLELPPRLTVSQWADRHRIIARGTGPEPGPWRTDRSPWLREPMDSVSVADVKITVLKLSSQVGKTEVLINVAGYFVDQDPAPQMFVLPTLQLADSFSRSRFGPTINATPRLLDRSGEHSSRDGSTTILEKGYPGGDIVFAGANSPASLASRPRRIVAFDEIDKFKAAIGNDGDPIDQGIQRTQNFWNAKILLASTPSETGLSQIDEWFERSDKRFYEVPCHDCGEYQPLEWETKSTADDGEEIVERRVTWPKGQPEKAVYSCRDCGSVWEDRHRHLAVRAGRWRATASFKGIAGFHCNALVSPWVSLEELATAWEAAEGQPAKEQAFVNLKLGLSYNPTKKATTSAQELLARRGDYGHAKLPDDVLLITAGVDVQGDRWECTYLGWGIDDRKWVIDHVKLFGDPTDPNAWRRVDTELLQRTFLHPCGQHLRVESAVVDAGYLQQKVLDFCREASSAWKPYFAGKGVRGEGRPLWKESAEKFKLGAKLYIVGVDDGKTTLYQELAVRPDKDSGIEHFRVHFPAHLEIDYFEQLISERVKITYPAGRPKREWVLPGGKRNEALDCFVGAMAARARIPIIDYHARRDAMQGTAKQVDYGDLAQLFKK